MTHRYYDPRTGRFINRDPIGYQGGVNLYGYASGNPVNESDPDGTRDGDSLQQLGAMFDTATLKDWVHWTIHNDVTHAIKVLAIGLSYVPLPENPAADAKAIEETSVLLRSLNIIERIGGRRPYNYKFAGKLFALPEAIAKKYPAGVKFTADGFPDFSPYATQVVKVKGLIGDAYEDFKLANKAAGLARTPKGYTWHHVQDGETMQLVPTDLHEAIRHSGGAAIIRNKNAVLP